MKNFIINFALIFFAFAQFSFSQSGWISQYSGVNAKLYSVKFINLQTGWCVGDSGKILKTINGGINWIQYSNSFNRNLRSITFPSESIGFIVGDSGIVLKTTNSGINWIDLNFNSGPLNSSSFINENVGFIAGDSCFKTSDGGDSWNQIGNSQIGFINSIHFVNELTGWSAGGYTGFLEEAVAKTTNGGFNWFLQYYTGIDDQIKSVFFIDPIHGWIGSPYSMTGATIFRTTNGGDNWIDFYPFTESNINSIFFIDVSKGWACGSNERILYSSNGGISWVHQTPNLINFIFRSIFFQDSLTGWVVGDSGKILKTSTGGVLTNFSNTSIEIPNKYFLFQNYPNPFNPNTIIRYQLSSTQTNSMSNQVFLNIYDALGSEVKILVNKKQNAGTYEVDISGQGLPSGLYFYSLRIDGDLINTKKMILLK
ncbi:MAG: YCF48-related protein [Ignavibacteria bacterium]